jgi:hypothetical protein
VGRDEKMQMQMKYMNMNKATISIERRLFDIASVIGLFSVVFLFVIVLIMGAFEELFPEAPTERAESCAQLIALCAIFLFALTTILLWVEGWIFIWAGWGSRSYLANAFLIVFQIMGTVFAAFILHFVRRSATNKNNKCPDS